MNILWNSEKMTFLRRNDIKLSLIVTQYSCYKDLVLDKKCKTKELKVCELTNDIWEQCLMELEKNKCSYIIAWYNNDNVAIYTKLNKLISIWKSRFWVWYTYWINKPNNHLIWDIDWYVTRYRWYSVMPWNTLYRLICEANYNWYILEWDLKDNYRKNYVQKKASTLLDKQQRIVLKNLKRYSNRIKELWDRDEPTQEEDYEMMMYRKKFNVMNAIKIAKVFESWDEEQIKKIMDLVKDSKIYYEVINRYTA